LSAVWLLVLLFRVKSLILECGLVLSQSFLYNHFVSPNAIDTPKILATKNTPREQGSVVLDESDLETPKENLFYEQVRAMLSVRPKSYDPRLKVAELRAGDRVRDSDGRVYTLDEFLGHGNVTHIWSIRELPEEVLRLPLVVDGLANFIFGAPSELGLYYYSSYYDSMMAAKNEGLPVIPVSRRGGLVFSRRYLEFETLEDFLDRSAYYNLQMFAARYEGFKVFLKSLVGKRGLSDVVPHNIAWDPRTQNWFITDVVHISKKKPLPGRLHPYYFQLRDSILSNSNGRALWNAARDEIGRPKFTLRFRDP